MSGTKLPRQFRLRVADELGLSESYANVRRFSRREKSRAVVAVRTFLGLRRCIGSVREELAAWLRDEVATTEGDVAAIVNAAVERCQQRTIELPRFPTLIRLARWAC